MWSARRDTRTCREVNGLIGELQAFRALRDPRQKPLEVLRIVDIAMQDLGDVALIEDALFRGENVEHQLRTGLYPCSVLLPLRLVKGEPFEIDGARLGLGLALQRLGANTDMGCRFDVDAALGIGPAIDRTSNPASARWWFWRSSHLCRCSRNSGFSPDQSLYWIFPVVVRSGCRPGR